MDIFGGALFAKPDPLGWVRAQLVTLSASLSQLPVVFP